MNVWTVWYLYKGDGELHSVYATEDGAKQAAKDFETKNPGRQAWFEGPHEVHGVSATAVAA